MCEVTSQEKETEILEVGLPRLGLALQPPLTGNSAAIALEERGTLLYSICLSYDILLL